MVAINEIQSIVKGRIMEKKVSYIDRNWLEEL